MAKPAIKGTLFAAVVADLQAAMESKQVTTERVESQLEAGDLALLDEKINPAGWYDIDSYHRMVELLCDAQGGGHDGYWLERGASAARRMAEAGIYQQMDYLGRTLARNATDPAARFAALGKDLRLLMSLQASMLNFGSWKCVTDPEHEDRYRVEIREVGGIPDGVFLAAMGMFNEMSVMAHRSGKSLHWEFRRMRPDFVVIGMTHGL
jgi:hypothetical protein